MENSAQKHHDDVDDSFLSVPQVADRLGLTDQGTRGLIRRLGIGQRTELGHWRVRASAVAEIERARRVLLLGRATDAA